MGRQKQTSPLQRTPSQLVHIDDAAPKSNNGTAGPPVSNGSAPKAPAALEAVADTPGLSQLVICVLGIYAAL